MKFLIDAQLPRRLAVHLQNLGHDVVHTLDMPSGNRTTDTVINRRSVIDQRILTTLDNVITQFAIVPQCAESTGNQHKAFGASGSGPYLLF